MNLRKTKLSGRLKWIVGGIAVTVFVAAWTVVGLAILAGPEIKSFTVMVTVAALASEGLFWAAAAILGVTVIESRRRIWGWIKRPFARSGDAG